MKNREIRSALLGVCIVLGAFVPLTVAPQGGPKGGDRDAITAARFELVIDGVSIATFSELAGITSGYDIDFVEYSERDGVLLPPTRKPPAVVLRRAKTADLAIWRWHVAALGGQQGARKSCSLVMYNTKGDPVARYHLTDAWPAKVEIGALKAGASEVLMETVTMVVERIDRVVP
ncbi:MAG TPA: phage tail protein [Casimicrobiaceae bacterium]|jgi:phage tail-like protein